MKITITHLYSEELNIYGDRGNIITLIKRLQWRGFTAMVDYVGPGDRYDFKKTDIVFGGGGQDRGQSLAAADLLKRRDNLVAAVEEGLVVLTICGTYQLFGHGFTTLEGSEIPGIGLFKAHTIGSQLRMVGNLVADTSFGELVGFENHSGQTVLDSGQEPLGTVIKGYGNNANSKNEGAITKNVFGTYMHGPVLPKNPRLADELINRALARRGIARLKPLDDELEHQTAAVAKTRSR